MVLILIGCTAQPEQTIVDMPNTDAVKAPSVTPEVKEDTPQDVTPPKVIPKEVLPADLALGLSGLPKGTAGWAVDEAYPVAREWAKDAVLFGMNGYNIFDGMIRDDFDIVTYNKVYKDYFVVSFTAGSKGREVLDVTVNWEGPSERVVKRFLPGNFSEYGVMNGWNIDSDDIAGILETVRQGAGFSIPTFELHSAGFRKKEIGENMNTISTDSGDIPISEVYNGIDSDVPICTVVTYYEVAYDIDCESGKIIGFYQSLD